MRTLRLAIVLVAILAAGVGCIEDGYDALHGDRVEAQLKRGRILPQSVVVLVGVLEQRIRNERVPIEAQCLPRRHGTPFLGTGLTGVRRESAAGPPSWTACCASPTRTSRILLFCIDQAYWNRQVKESLAGLGPYTKSTG